MELLSLGLIAATVVVIMPVVGSILAVALIVAPAAAARRLAPSPAWMLVASPAIAVVVAVAGLWISRSWSISPGGAITLLAAAAFGLAQLVPGRTTVGAR